MFSIGLVKAIQVEAATVQLKLYDLECSKQKAEHIGRETRHIQTQPMSLPNC